MKRETTRRTFVVRTFNGLAGAALLAACGDTERANGTGQSSQATSGSGGHAGSPGTGGSSTAGNGTGASSSGGAGTGGTGGESGTCKVYPQQTEGPFYLDLDLVRSDITEGKPGTPMSLEIEVMASDCTPLEGAAVDVWQCDAGGIYSGFPGQLGGLDTTGQKFLRGTQISDADGKVTFESIYPGWYPGRTTHIHFKIHPTPTTAATSQLYFPEDVTAEAYLVAPYDTHGPKDTTNLQDTIAQGGSPPLLAVSKTADGYVAKLTITVA
jgi:protocatechuate 3,4-dioxygenase beta subunit